MFFGLLFNSGAQDISTPVFLCICFIPHLVQSPKILHKFQLSVFYTDYFSGFVAFYCLVPQAPIPAVPKFFEEGETSTTIHTEYGPPFMSIPDLYCLRIRSRRISGCRSRAHPSPVCLLQRRWSQLCRVLATGLLLSHFYC